MMPLVAGTRLGPYEILSALGAGGMGEVYRARDPRLGRDVAIKALPAAFAQDAERLARFEREAKLLASLSHPNIAGIFGLEESGGARYLVLELVEGETLAARLAGGALPLDETLAIVRQIAAGVEAAHEAGVVHRDLKPGNVMLKPDGTVKVLDFGLAKGGGGASAGSDPNLSASPTMTYAATQRGVILGTAAYMSPEQARGRAVDRRTDIWSFGCVLYECLAGRRPFEGDTVSDLVARILEREPDWSALSAATPPRLLALLRRCLEKDAKQRLRDIGDARLELEAIAAGDRGPAAVPERRVATRVIVALVAGLVALAAVAGWALFRPAPSMPAATELSIMLPPGQRLGEDIGYHFFALSPDGRAIVHTVVAGGRRTLHLRRLDRRDGVDLAGTDNARNPFFSPDGEWIGFFNGLKLCKVSVNGGAPVELADAGQDRLGTWLSDGSIVFSNEPTSPLLRVPERGGAPVAVTQLDTTQHERSHRFPSALAGGPWVVFTVGRLESPGGYDDSPIDAVNVRTGERRRLLKGARRALWAPPHWLLYVRGNDLYAARIDPHDPRPVSESAPVLSGVAGETSSGAAFVDVSDDGTLAWVPAEPGSRQREIGWLDRSGRWTPTPVPAGEHTMVKLSPDGTRALVLTGPGGGSSDVWLADLATGGLTRLTYGGRAGSAEWLRDGVRFAYSRSEGEGGETVVVRRLDGAGAERVLDRARTPLLLNDVLPDGTRVLYSEYGAARGRIRTAAVDGDPDVRVLAPDPGDDHYEQAGTVSPDGRWLAYISNRTHRDEVYLRAFDGSGGRWQVSNGGGGGVRWGREGRELFFSQNEQLTRVPVEARGTDLVIGQPEPLFDIPPTPIEPGFRDYAYDRVHDRFLVTRPPSGVLERREIALSLDWVQRLETMNRQGPASK